MQRIEKLNITHTAKLLQTKSSNTRRQYLIIIHLKSIEKFFGCVDNTNIAPRYFKLRSNWR